MDKLYTWYLWYNHHENLWYAIPRDKIVDFHNGTLKEMIHAKTADRLIKYLTMK